MNRKPNLYFFSVLFVSMIVLACASKKEADEQDGGETAAIDKWNEMDEFHMIMAESFHPYKDSANLEPAKVNANEMADLAAKWADAPLPAKVDNEHVKAKLAQLKTDTKTFSQTVTSGDTSVIGTSLTALHDLFHSIQESWYGGDGHGHKH